MTRLRGRMPGSHGSSLWSGAAQRRAEKDLLARSSRCGRFQFFVCSVCTKKTFRATFAGHRGYGNSRMSLALAGRNIVMIDTMRSRG